MQIPKPATASSPALGEPLVAKLVRPLDVAAHPQVGRPPHVAAGSGLQVLGQHTYVIADDELHLARFPTSTSSPGSMERALAGSHLPLDPHQRKQAKPDIEALVRLPGIDKTDALLLGVPSGSKPQRTRGFGWRLDEHGALVGTPREVDFAPLYDALRGRVRGKLNIEGAAVRGAELVLLHRGNAAGGVAAAVALDLRVVERQAREGRVDASSIAGVTEYDLGLLDGVKLGFTDAAGLPGGRIAFSAAAEVTDDPVDDGSVVGSVIGVLGPGGEVEHVRPLSDDGIKVEGLAVVQSGRGVASVDAADGVRLHFVTDADDASRPSRLMSVDLPLS